MVRRRACFLIIIISFLFGGTQAVFPADKVQAFSPQVIHQGSVGEDVIELQSRLQYLGFYKGKIDGVFGWSTYWALRNFQYEFGMKVDGLAGEAVKSKLIKASKYTKKSQPASNTVNVPQGYSDNDIRLLANAVHGEARGEPYVGQVAVAAVILNRIESPSFPNTISGVIFEPGAFTAVADGQIWLTPNETAKKAVVDAINGWDPSGNALYYFNPETATSKWIWSRPQIKQIGKHIFCK